MDIEFPVLKTVSKIQSRPVIDYNINEATLEIVENKIQFSKEAIKALNAQAGDRILITYWNVDQTKTIPIIGKSEWFTDNTDGNKLTKSNTISFRGTQKDILLIYGSYFKLIPFRNFYKLEKIEKINEDLTEEEQFLNDLN